MTKWYENLTSYGRLKYEFKETSDMILELSVEDLTELVEKYKELQVLTGVLLPETKEDKVNYYKYEALQGWLDTIICSKTHEDQF